MSRSLSNIRTLTAVLIIPLLSFLSPWAFSGPKVTHVTEIIGTALFAIPNVVAFGIPQLLCWRLWKSKTISGFSCWGGVVAADIALIAFDLVFLLRPNDGDSMGWILYYATWVIVVPTGIFVGKAVRISPHALEDASVKLMKSLPIILLCIFAAIIYGIIHDQITARICVEYFTIGHPPIFDTTSPTLLALGWGIIATWWVGLILGIPLAIAARFGTNPKRTAASLIRPILILLLIMACCALAAGLIGYLLARNHIIYLAEPMASSLPPDRQIPFLVDLWTHIASYLTGFLGGIVLTFLTWRSRRSASVNPPPNPQ